MRLATRTSALALWQANRIAALIRDSFTDVRIEFVHVTTTADKHADRPLHEMGDKGLFVKEIEQALISGEADAGVHSLKDVPGELPDSLALVAFPEREDVRDVFISANCKRLADLPRGSRVATSSLRRQGQLLRAAPGLIPTPVRGNIDTRLQKLREGQFDAMILAAAGIRRLGSWSEEMSLLTVDEMLPAPGQGALAVEAPVDSPFADILSKLDNAVLRRCIDIEREFVRLIGADCKTPAGCYCRHEGSELTFSAMICSPDGKQLVRCDLQRPPAAPDIARQAADDLLQRGGSEILSQLK